MCYAFDLQYNENLNSCIIMHNQSMLYKNSLNMLRYAKILPGNMDIQTSNVFTHDALQ